MFAKKMAHNKILKMYEIVQKTYGKISEDIYDIERWKLKKKIRTKKGAERRRLERQLNEMNKES